jgi:ComF family protein
MEPLGVWFAERLAEVVKAEGLDADVVVPVPLHRDRERERGYNQADLIARPLAKRLNLPHRAVLLVRTRPRPDKQVLSLEERWESVRGAFATRPGSQVDNLRVLLVDDVMTTGATLDACSRALLDAGARSVIGLTVARAMRKPITGPSQS